MSEDKTKIEEMLTEKISESAKAALEEFQSIAGVEATIKDNKIVFILDGKKYRIRTPNQEDLLLMDNAKETKLMEYIKNKTYMSEDYWKAVWKEKGLDLDELEAKITDVKDGMYDLLFKLATLSQQKDIDVIKGKINEKKSKLNEYIIKKTDKLQYSIEQKMRDFGVNYTAYFMLEEEIDAKWKRPFDSFDDFMKSDNSKLVYSALEYTMKLLYGTIEGLE